MSKTVFKLYDSFGGEKEDEPIIESETIEDVFDELRSQIESMTSGDEDVSGEYFLEFEHKK